MISHNWSPMKRLIWLRGSGITGEAETWSTIVGNPVSFTAKAAPLRQLSVAFSPVQAGTGDPSPDNVRPISGWNSLTVEQTGKNLLNPNDPDFGLYTIGPDGREITGENNRITTGYIRCKAGIVVTADSQIMAGTNTKWGFVGIAAYDESKQFLGRATLTSANKTITYTTPAGTGYIRFFEQITALLSVTSPQVFADYEQTLAFGEVTEYAAYNGRAISITIGQTVYSGTVDVLTGVVTVTMANWNMGSKTWTKYSGKTSVYITTFSNDAPAPKRHPDVGDVANAVCSCYRVVSGDDIWYQRYANSIGIGRVGLFDGYWMVDDRIHTEDNINEFLNGQYLCYELATPITIQLTPQQVSSLLGENNMWSDANGDLTVEYRSN